MSWGWIVAIIASAVLLALAIYLGVFFWQATFRG